MLLVAPGSVTPAREINAILRARWEGMREAHRLDQEDRARKGVPVGEDLDWQQEAKRTAALGEAAKAEDLTALRLGYQAGLYAVTTAVDDPGDWRPVAGIEGVTVRVQLPDAATSKRLRSAWADAMTTGDEQAQADTARAILDAGLVEVGGLQVVEGEGETPAALQRPWEDETLQLLEPLVPVLLSVVLYLWSLDRGKAWRSGAPPRAT